MEKQQGNNQNVNNYITLKQTLDNVNIKSYTKLCDYLKTNNNFESLSQSINNNYDKIFNIISKNINNTNNMNYLNSFLHKYENMMNPIINNEHYFQLSIGNSLKLIIENYNNQITKYINKVIINDSYKQLVEKLSEIMSNRIEWLVKYNNIYNEIKKIEITKPKNSPETIIPLYYG